MLPSKQKILPEEYQALVQSCQIIEKDAYGEKVLRSNDGIFIKIFRRKRLLSSALVYPYAHRFIHNAKNLSTLGIPTVRVIKCAHCSNPARDIVWYEPIQGMTLREFCRKENPASLMRSFGEFIAHIHETGILFRSLHWGNYYCATRFKLWSDRHCGHELQKTPPEHPSAPKKLLPSPEKGA